MITLEDRNIILKALTIALTTITRVPCTECIDFTRDGYCERYEQDVPPEHQAAGCDAGRPDIPF